MIIVSTEGVALEQIGHDLFLITAGLIGKMEGNDYHVGRFVLTKHEYDLIRAHPEYVGFKFDPLVNTLMGYPVTVEAEPF